MNKSELVDFVLSMIEKYSACNIAEDKDMIKKEIENNLEKIALSVVKD